MRENGAGRPPTPTRTWVFDPATKPGAGARPGRVTHCCFEHAGQNFGSLDRGPRAICLKCRYGWRTSELKSKTSRKRNPVDPVAEEIPDAEHELVIERVAAIDVAKASGTVCLRLAGKSGRRVSRVWDVQAVTGAVAGLADQLTEVGVQRSPSSPRRTTGGSGTTCWRRPGSTCSWSTPAT
jgi:hypothetical protein